MASLSDRNLRIVEARNSGRTYASIADEHGISAARVRDICVSAEYYERRAQKLRGWPANVDVRTINALKKAGLQLADAPFDPSIVSEIEGVGVKSIAVLSESGLLKRGGKDAMTTPITRLAGEGHRIAERIREAADGSNDYGHILLDDLGTDSTVNVLAAQIVDASIAPLVDALENAGEALVDAAIYPDGDFKMAGNEPLVCTWCDAKLGYTSDYWKGHDEDCDVANTALQIRAALAQVFALVSEDAE